MTAVKVVLCNLTAELEKTFFILSCVECFQYFFFNQT